MAIDYQSKAFCKALIFFFFIVLFIKAIEIFSELEGQNPEKIAGMAAQLSEWN